MNWMVWRSTGSPHYLGSATLQFVGTYRPEGVRWRVHCEDFWEDTNEKHRRTLARDGPASLRIDLVDGTTTMSAARAVSGCVGSGHRNITTISCTHSCDCDHSIGGLGFV